ncbi:MAG: antA/AntB antirepressor family protein, partial [Desulfovibrionaceae bacterium]|nr:antA/AntB antirepressor family protein [Desulfovibrionaceae bacterium]
MTASQLIPVVSGTIGNVQCLTVDGRALHGVLEVRRDFTTWIKGRISKYDFAEGLDFDVLPKTGENSEAGRPSQVYTCTLDMCKELC